jgi:hypothetical protein
MSRGVPASWRLALVVAGLFALGPARLGAQVVVLLSVEDFTTPTTLVDFEFFPDLTQVPYTSASLNDQWISLGVLMSDDSVADGISAYSGTFSIGPVSGSRAVADSVNAAGGFVQFDFVQPGTRVPATVLEAGLWVLNGDTPATVEFFDGDGLLIQSLTSAAGTSFVGLRASQGIGRVRVTDSDFYLVDDLRFTNLTVIPEPAAGLLAGLGLAVLWLGGRISRRRL